MKTQPFLVHALSPLHVGTGQSVGVVDLPIARMRATGIPVLPGSSLKGVLRDLRQGEKQGEMGPVAAVFGPSGEESALHAGALVVGDARLLALPVRSFRGTFAWVTSPLLLFLAERDLGWSVSIPTFAKRGARVAPASVCIHEGYLYLEDLDLQVATCPVVEQWAKHLAPIICSQKDIFTSRFAIVDDETMAFLWETATQIDARIRVDNTTGVAADRALWLEESLPSETLLLGLLAADRSRRQQEPMTAAEVLSFALPGEVVVQLGGKATTGRGRCRVIPLVGKEEIAHAGS